MVGYAVIAWFLRYISHNSFRPFVIYRLVLAAVLFLALFAGWTAPIHLGRLQSQSARLNARKSTTDTTTIDSSTNG